MKRPFVIDNGSFRLKCGFSDLSLAPTTMLNLRASLRTKAGDKRSYIYGDDISHYNMGRLTVQSGFEKGYVVDWKVQMDIWANSFSYFGLTKEKIQKTPLILSSPLIIPQTLRQMIYQVIFEEFGFPSLCLAPEAFLALWGVMNEMWDGKPLKETAPEEEFLQSFPECAIIIDVGHSSTRITPLYRTLPVEDAMKTVAVGGKHLTNILKGIVCFRSWDVSEEFLLMNHMKEQTCFVYYEKERQKIKGEKETVEKTEQIKDQTDCCCSVEAVAMKSAVARIEEAVEREKLRKESLKMLMQNKLMQTKCGENVLEKVDCDEEWLALEYVVPDFVTSFEGFVREPAFVKKWKELMKERRQGEDEKSNKLRKSGMEMIKDIDEEDDDDDDDEDDEDFQLDENEENDDDESDLNDLTDEDDGANTKKKRRIIQHNGSVHRGKKMQKSKKIIQTRELQSSGSTGKTDVDIQSQSTQKELLTEMSQPTHQTVSQSSSDSDTSQTLPSSSSSASSSVEPERVIPIDVHRITIPEVLFNPTDVGIPSGGISKAVLDSLSLLPRNLRGLFSQNIFIVGGCSKLKGLAERLYQELRPELPDSDNLRVIQTENPEMCCWNGGVLFSLYQQDFTTKWSLSKEDYLSSQEQSSFPSSASSSIYTPRLPKYSFPTCSISPKTGTSRAKNQKQN